MGTDSKKCYCHMGRCLSLLIIFLLSTFSHAQTYMSEDELKNYLANNINNLHPLEGLYFVESTNNLFFKIETSHYPRAFLFSKQKNLYEELCYDEKTGRYKYLQDVQYDNSTQIFRYVSSKGQTISLYQVANPSHFSLNTNDGVTFDNNEYARLYPTEEMYKEAYAGKRIQEASNLLSNKYFSSALAILNDVLKTNKEPYAYYLRAGAYYGLKDCYSAIQDCNKALSFSIPSDNARAVYYLRGLCNFLVNNKEAGITDMKQAGEDGTKFLEENGYTKNSSTPKHNSNNRKTPTKKHNSSTPILKKTK